MIHVEIDPNSGFCFGVVRAIKMAEDHLAKGKNISSLGEMVHNAEEVKRLEAMGMHTITCRDLDRDKNQTVLIRAHGEPPSTYATLKDKGRHIVDATCPIVLKLQERVKKTYENHPGAHIVIYGKKGHAEVIGLAGQTNGDAFIMNNAEDVKKLNPDKPVFMFSQTTMPLEGFAEMKTALETYIEAEVISYDTICRKVAHRIPEVKRFAAMHDVCVFVSGKNSSNGKMLYNAAKKANSSTYFVSHANEIDKRWFKNEMSVGVCGATSTPQWQMEEAKTTIESWYKND